jgi:hypothetical protein
VIDTLAAIIALTSLTLCGAGFLHALDASNRFRWLEKISLGYGLGGGFLAILLQCSQLLRIRFSLPLCLVPLLPGWLLLLMRCPIQRGKWSIPSPFSRWELFLFLALGMEILSCFVRAGSTPSMTFDAAGIWGYKAKQIYLSQGIPASELGNTHFPIYHADYPLLIPLNQAFLYFFLGGFNDFAAKLLFAGFYLSTLVLFYSFSARVVPARLPRLMLTFLLASTPYFSDQATNGYADLPLAYFFFCSVILLFQWSQSPSLIFAVLSALYAGFAGITKNEGLMLAIVMIPILMFAWLRLSGERRAQTKIIHLFWFVAILAGTLLPWLIIRQQIGFMNDLINSRTFAQLGIEKLRRLGPILWQYQKIIFGLRNWNLSWILVLGCLTLGWRRWFRSEAMYLLLPAGLGLAGYTVVFMISTYDLQWHLSTAASRLFLHFLPLAFFFLGLVWQKGVEYDKSAASGCQ